MLKSETDWYAKYAAALNTIHKLQADNLQQAERIRELEREAENYRSVMIAAAEEIHEYWDAHCDEEGYGPANLMYRLENGIPAEYGYKVGTFNKMQSRIDGLEQQLAEVVEYAGKLRDSIISLTEDWGPLTPSPAGRIAMQLQYIRAIPLPKAMHEIKHER